MPLPSAVAANHQIWPGLPMGNPAYLSMSKVAHDYPLVQVSTSNSSNYVTSSKKVPIKTKKAWNLSAEGDSGLVPDLRNHVAQYKKGTCVSSTGQSTPSSQLRTKQCRKETGGLSRKMSAVKELLEGYPLFANEDEVAWLEKDECSKCKINVGRLAVKPCGHGKFCFSCMNAMRGKAMKLQRPGRCLSQDCITIVKSWFVLVNISNSST